MWINKNDTVVWDHMWRGAGGMNRFNVAYADRCKEAAPPCIVHLIYSPISLYENKI